jgi:transcription antitermination factor NusG
MERVNCIIYLDSKFLKNLDRDLARCSLDISIIIPTVRILDKRIKGKELYAEVPLLLNYGFISIPKKEINNDNFRQSVKKYISCISGFLMSKNNKPETVTDLEINTTLNMGNRLSIYSGLDFNSKEGRKAIKDEYEPKKDREKGYIEGKMVKLKGFPFDNLDAQVVKINFSNETVNVLLHINTGGDLILKPVTISFNNLFYSIYDENLEEEGREKSIEDLKHNKPGVLDRINFKEQEVWH